MKKSPDASERSAVSSEPESRLFYGWIIVFALGLTIFAGGAGANPVLGVFQGPMTEEFGWTRAQFVLPMSIGSFLGGLAGMVLGPVMDRYGSKWVMTTAVVSLGAALMLMGAVQELWEHFALQMIGRTVATGTFMMVVGIVIPKWFVRKRGRAVALTNLGQRASVMVFPFVAERIIQGGSWRVAWVVIGVAVWIAALPALLFLRRRPEDHGLLPDGERRDGSGVHENRHAGRSLPKPLEELHITSREALRLPVFYIVASVVVIQSLANTSVQFHWFTVLTDQGIDTTVAVISIAIAPIVSIPVSIATGFIAERLSVRKVMALGYVLMAASIVILTVTRDAVGAYAFGLAFGVTSGVLITTVQLVWPYYFGRGSVGAIRGMVAPVHMGANALGPIAAALSFDFLGSYVPAYATIGALCLVGAMLLWLAKRPQTP